MTIKVALAGAGAFGIKHLDGIRNIDGVEVVSLISRDLEKTREVAGKYGIGHVTTDLADSLALPGLDAVILCMPTQMHADQTLACLKAGKHVQVEIPLADSLAGAEAVSVNGYRLSSRTAIRQAGGAMPAASAETESSPADRWRMVTRSATS